MTTKTSHNESRDIKEQFEAYRRIFDSIHCGAIVTDAEGYIIYFNEPYGKFLNINPEDQIGRHCTDIVENTRMHIVAKTGRPEINDFQLIQGHNMIVQRIPIKKNGKVIAVYGQVMFRDVKDVARLAKKLSLLESKVKQYEEELITLRSTRYTIDGIVGVSEAITSLKRNALKAAANSFPVLITGESGTGKELFVQAIHHASPRSPYPFVRINCSAIPRELIESELFGYSKGAFTGASRNGKPGKFALADHGTIFLDEIGDMPLEMQPKLLRVLEEKEFSQVGGTAVIRSDFRLITATNQNLQEMVPEKRFRMDLFYRLNVIPLHIPPLRERRDDIIPLAKHLLKKLTEEANFPEVLIDPDVENVLKNCDWPGNVRELQNVIERTLSSLEGNVIYISNLPFYLHGKPYEIRNGQRILIDKNPSSLKSVHGEAEKKAILHALNITSNNKKKAADILGIHRTLLYKKMRKYNIPLSYKEESSPM
ncbi:MAG: sigma 54-interacting transcriptional regulator [Deltaproteobacteria bacterium]|nr:sigma 54-interacting transcriptional regulator [Deltaproteobacteria bacterium]